MTVIQALMKLASARTNLISLLRSAASKAPDLAPELNEWITALDSAASPEGLADLAVTVTKELGDIAKGKINPRNKPGDAI